MRKQEIIDAHAAYIKERSSAIGRFFGVNPIKGRMQDFTQWLGSTEFAKLPETGNISIVEFIYYLFKHNKYTTQWMYLSQTADYKQHCGHIPNFEFLIASNLSSDSDAWNFIAKVFHDRNYYATELNKAHLLALLQALHGYATLEKEDIKQACLTWYRDATRNAMVPSVFAKLSAIQRLSRSAALIVIEHVYHISAELAEGKSLDRLRHLCHYLEDGKPMQLAIEKIGAGLSVVAAAEEVIKEFQPRASLRS